MRAHFSSSLLALMLLAGCVSTGGARALHDNAIVIDAHADIPDPAIRPGLQGTIDQDTQVAFARLRAGGVDSVILSVFAEQGPRTPEGYAAARVKAEAKLAAIHAIAAAHPSEAVIALSAEDIERAAAQGKTAIMIGMLNAYALGRDPGQLDYFYQHGVRVLGLTHAGNNDFADSSRPSSGDTVGENGGLSALGRAAIARANQLGVLVDVSQLSTPALMQALETSRAPVIASHSNIRAMVESPRNLTDAELDAIAAHGGVVGVNAYSAYLRALTEEERTAAAAVRARYMGPGVYSYDGMNWEQREALRRDLAAVAPRASVAQFVDQIDYAVRRIGADHVAISSDFNHGGGIDGWLDESGTPNIAAELVRRGYSAADIRKILGGNVLRVLRAAEAGAQR